MIDFGSNVKSLFHKALTIDFGEVLEGVSERTLLSMEKTIMRQGRSMCNEPEITGGRTITGNTMLPELMLIFLPNAERLVI